MADNVDITPGSGRTVSGDERTIGAITVLVQRVIGVGASTIANGQYTATTTASNLVTTRDTRKRLIIKAFEENTSDVWVGIITVSTTDGFKLPPGSSLTLETTRAVQIIATTTGQKVYYIEEYDS